MNKSCKNCEWLDYEHAQMYEEFICKKADITIELRKGQGKPTNCPLDKRRKQHE